MRVNSMKMIKRRKKKKKYKKVNLVIKFKAMKKFTFNSNTMMMK